VIPPTARLALLMTGYLRLRNGKMGFGLLRYSQNPIACVIAADEVGNELFDLVGFPTDVPIVGSVAQAHALGADTLVIAVATSGGVLPDGYRSEILDGLHRGMSLVNGLHGKYADDPEYQAVKHSNAFIFDVRVEPSGLVSGRGRAREVSARRVLTVGTDMAIGKMTASLELDRAAQRRGLRSRFVATGQIGICISGDGVPLDAVRVDFASGSIEGMCLKYGNDNAVLWVEGQGSALHPGSTAWMPLLRGAMPTDLVLVHRAGQTVLDGLEDVAIPPLREVVQLYERVAASSPSFPAAKVRGIALNCARLSPTEIDAACAAVEAETGLVCVDVLHHGADRLVDAIAELPPRC
jgi:uncharacterized NAD-dependent epimerase/dehydratase family protein